MTTNKDALEAVNICINNTDYSVNDFSRNGQFLHQHLYTIRKALQEQTKTPSYDELMLCYDERSETCNRLTEWIVKLEKEKPCILSFDQFLEEDAIKLGFSRIDCVYLRRKYPNGLKII